MNLRIDAIRRAFVGRGTSDPVHFHLQGEGRPLVCDLSHCESPGLTVKDVSG